MRRDALTDYEMNFGFKERKREALIKFVGDQAYGYDITFALNAGAKTLDALKSRVRRWAQRIDRKCLGGRYMEKPEHRLRGILFPELLDTNAHLHGQMHISPKYLDRPAGFAALRALMNYLWLKQAPGGSVEIDEQVTPFASGIYHTKEFRRADFDERYFFVEDFWGAKSNTN